MCPFADPERGVFILGPPQPAAVDEGAINGTVDVEHRRIRQPLTLVDNLKQGEAVKALSVDIELEGLDSRRDGRH